jgi:hypothetical protein
MNNFWLKVAGVMVAVVVIIIIVGTFMSGDSSEPTEPDDGPTTFDEVVERDKHLLDMPTPAEAGPGITEQPENHLPITESQTPQPEVVTEPEPAKKYILPSSITEKTTLYFVPMEDFEVARAEQLMNVAGPGFSIGRLPMTSYTLAIEGCRQVLDQWPDSKYAFMAKRMMEQIPERYWDLYDITEEKLDISKYFIQRKGTEPAYVEPLPER